MSDLLALRKRYTAQEIATMYGVSRRTIYNWLNGTTPLPRHRRALEGGFQGTGKDRIYVLPRCLLPDDDTAVERLAAALDGRTAWHRKRDATLIIERLREGGQR